MAAASSETAASSILIGRISTGIRRAGAAAILSRVQ
jgi:hypothetical protein